MDIKTEQIYLKFEDIAQQFGVKKQTVIRWEKSIPDFPPRYKINQTVVFKAAEVAAWVDAQQVAK